MLKGALSSQRLFDFSLASKRRETSKDGNRVVQKYGEIYGKQALRDIAEDRQEELRVVNMRQERQTKPWRLKYKQVMKDLLRQTNQLS